MADVQGTLVRAMDKALAVQRPAVLAQIRILRRTRPDATPVQVLSALEKWYLAQVAAAGGAAGAAAAVPGVGTVAGLAASAIEIPVSLELSVLFALAYAEIHGVPVEDLERRQTLVYGILLGKSGSATIGKIAERSGKHWARMLVRAVDPSTLKAVNKVLGRNFVTKYGTREGILVLGREVPFGIGAGIGAAGNAGFGYLTVRAARRAFGAAPDEWPSELRSTTS